MSRSRYEPVPQRDSTTPPPPLSSNSIYNYAYNSGLPTSTPNSPPPSFHSSQNIAPSSYPFSTPHTSASHPSLRNQASHAFDIDRSTNSTPRPTPSTTTASTGASEREGEELWGVAESTCTGGTTTGCDAHAKDAELKELRQRVERLEESLGRLLVISPSCYPSILSPK
ncbi:hypothetical protein B7494_g6202 [Chlorociboria aeruginascens]|nr:hypothetical protein B7494_g6202 [Chlorociboria aeruginascens]